MLLRLAHLTVTNAFAALRLLPTGDREKDAEILALLHQIISPLIGGWLADRTGDFAVTYLVASAAGVTAGLVATLLPVNNRAGRPSRG